MGSQASSAAVMVALRRIVRLLRLADRAAETAVGLSAAQLFVLQTLEESPGSSLAELAELTMTDQSSVSTVVAKLVSKRLVARKTAPDDRRRAELRLTASGARAVRRAPRAPQARIGDFVREMPDELREGLVRGLESLAAGIGANELQPRMLFEDEPKKSRKSR